MKTGLRAALTTNLSPVFFGLTCLLLISVGFTARVMVNEVMVAQDGANGFYYFMQSPFPWLAAN